MLFRTAVFGSQARAESGRYCKFRQIAESLSEYARGVAEEEKVSMNQFFVTAIAEKVFAQETESYFRERLARGEEAALDAWLAHSPSVPPEIGDKILR